MDRLTLFEKALRETQSLRDQFPGMPTIASIVRQLDYLIALDSGQSTDRSRIEDVVLGVQAAREIEALDERCAETLHEVSARVRAMM